jgi:preprotein translocase subunit SecD
VATTTTSRPGRLLLALGVVLVLLFGIMALTRSWEPKLGLDLAGRHHDHPDGQSRHRHR